MVTTRRAARAGLHFLASVMMTSGVLLIADAGATFAWQEPVSAVIAELEQNRLADELEEREKLFASDRETPELVPLDELRRRFPRLARRLARHTDRGDPIGRIELPTLDRSYVVVEGTNTTTLRKGPGHYPDTPLPGQAGTVAVAGHRTTYGAPFRTIDELERGEEIVARMPYGRFTYRVERSQIVKPDALWVKRRVRHDRLVLSACHPLYSASKRIVVFARLERAELL